MTQPHESTPLPWKKGTGRDFSPNVILDDKGDIILAPMGKKETGEQNGDYALTACNQYPGAVKLVMQAQEALLAMRDYRKQTHHGDDPCLQLLERTITEIDLFLNHVNK
jgi:hypothetical protein